jgi:hypothetical protein
LQRLQLDFVIRQAHFMAVVGVFVLGYAVLMGVGCAGGRSEAPQEEKQGHIEATKEGHKHTEATASEEARFEGTRKVDVGPLDPFTTNDLAGCPKGGLLSGTDKVDYLAGEKGDDEVRGLGGSDELWGGSRSDVLYGGDGNDYFYPGKGEDVIYGGDGNDFLNTAGDVQRDKLYCGEGKDRYLAANNANDYVDSSCEKKTRRKGRVAWSAERP